jgi:ankyrin repeat protein
MEPDGRCHCVVKTENRRCFGRAKEGKLYCYRDQHNCQNVDPPLKDWVLRDEYLRAAYDGDWTTMQKCLLASPQVSDRVFNTMGRLQRGAVHYAIAGEHIEIVKELFQRDLHNAPLVELCDIAVKSGNLAMVRGFVGNDNELFLPGIREDLLHIVLNRSIMYGRLHILHWFWKQYPSLVTEYLDHNERNVLMGAAMYNRVDMVRWILSLNMIPIGATDKNDLTVLQLVASKRTNHNLEIVKMLVIDGGAQLNDKYAVQLRGFSPFFKLLPYINEETLTWMIDGNYVDVEQQKEDDSLYHVMLSVCSFKMIRFFVLKYKPSRKVQDENNRWLDFLLVCSRNGETTKDNLDAARWLVENKYIDVDHKRPFDGSTGIVASCKFVIEEGLDEDSEIYLREVIKLVEIGGANIDICDNVGKSAWDYLSPLWQDQDTENVLILKQILVVFLPRSEPPQHVETALLADKTYRDLVKRGRRVHRALVDRRRESSLLLGNSSETTAGLPNDLVDIISDYDSNMSTEEMWNFLDT